MKFLLLSTLILTCFTPSNSQLIDITVCTDNSCSNNCISWTATNNECSTCRNSQCSVSNPSAMIQNMNSITFYTDTTCSSQNIVPGTSANLISLDNTCHLLYDNNVNLNIIGSYRASNKSALIGGIVGGILLLIFIIICISCICCCKRRQIEPPPVNAIVIDEKQLQPTIPRPLSGYGYAYNPQSQSQQTQQTPQQQTQYIYEPYAQQQYAQQQYAQQQYAPQQYAPQQYAPQQYAPQQYAPQQYAQQQQPTYYSAPLPSAPPPPASAPFVPSEYPQKYI